MSRNRLDARKLPDFVSFLEADGWISEAPKGDWEVARLRRDGKMAMIWRRGANHSGTTLTHLTMDRVAEVLFDMWLRERRK
jgi:hypothetical protein